jgi:hypothetical protein
MNLAVPTHSDNSYFHKTDDGAATGQCTLEMTLKIRKDSRLLRGITAGGKTLFTAREHNAK